MSQRAKPKPKSSNARRYGGLLEWTEYDGATVKLTRKQQHFATLVGQFGESQTQAYREAYNVDPERSDAYLWTDASNLAAHPKVMARVEFYKALREQAATHTVDEHRYQLQRLRDAAEREGNLSAALRAEELRGKLDGFYVERREVTLRDMRRDPSVIVRQIAGDDDVLFNRLMKSMAYQHAPPTIEHVGVLPSPKPGKNS